MPLSSDRVVEQARILHGFHLSERDQLDKVRRYWKGRQALPAVIPSSAPQEVKNLARLSRVNVCEIVVDTLAQSTFVEGYRGKDGEAPELIRRTWEANRMAARQSGIHRAAFAYGASYATVLPGDSLPVIKGASPRSMTCVYGESDDWPMWAFERLGRGLWRIFDEEAIYYVTDRPKPGEPGRNWEHLDTQIHGAPGVVPVVRFLDQVDLDADDDIEDADGIPLLGQVSPLMKVQDQIDLTTFGLMVAQWYSAFRQRYAIGWVPEDEGQKMKASASQLWTFDENPEEMQLGEFSQTQLDGYIKSREASIRHAAALSQTPAHELIGELVNLSAEALAAAEAGRDRKVDERQTLLGEGHEQMNELVAYYTGETVPEEAAVQWRDTSARAFAATVDALGKLTTMLGIPPQELWERVPGATQQDVARWKAAAQNGDSFRVLADMLERQSGDGDV